MARKNKDLSTIYEKLDQIKDTLTLARGLLTEAPKSVDKPMNNVRFITPHIKVEYEVYKVNEDRSVLDLLKNYEIWAHEICCSVFANKGSLKNIALRTHLIESLQICESLDYSFRFIFDKDKKK